MFKNTIKYIFKFQIPAIVWGFVVLWLSLLPKVEIEIPLHFQAIDKVVHFVFYFFFSVFLLYGFRQSEATKKRFWDIFGISFAIAFGGAIELLQEFVVITRTGDWFDFLANIAGVGIGSFVVIRRKKQ